MVAPNIPDVTLTSADPALLLCWEEQVKQGKDCFLVLKYQGGKITTTLQVSKWHEPVTPKLKQMPQASSQAEKKAKRNKKKKLEKLLSFHESLVNKKGLPQSRLMLLHSQQKNEQFKCDQCDYKAQHLN